MGKNKFFNRVFILTTVMSLYLMAIISGSQLWSNIVSPIVEFSIGYVIWVTGKYMKNHRICWIFLSLMVFSWGVIDSLWMAAYNIYGLYPGDIAIFSYLYTIPNIILTITAIIYFVRNIKRWNIAQLFLDIIITSIVLFKFISSLLFMDFNFNLINDYEIISTFIFLIADAFTLSVIFVSYLSSRVHKPSKTLTIILSGIVLYFACDLYYALLIFRDMYIPNSLIDFMYLCSLALFGFAIVYESYKPSVLYDPLYLEVPENTGSFNQYILLLFPITLYLLGSVSYKVLVQMIILVFVHQVFTSNIQKTIRNEYLLRKEKQMNEKLEDLIAERAKDLLLSNKALEELSKTDTLTGLYNRRYFLGEIDKAINIKNNTFSVFYMDIDHFKIINDTHGHQVGDQILKEISVRLIGWKSVDVIAARFSGDEFAVMVKGNTNNYRMERLCEEIIELFNKPFFIDSYIFGIEVSIGVSSYPKDATERDQLMKYADIAMYHAKKEYGSSGYALYDLELSEIMQRHNKIEMLLKRADFDKEFELNFQPQFKTLGNRLIGAEALLRWNSPIIGRIPPGEFIPIAEESGIILEIGKWVMDKAVDQICCWNKKYQRDLFIGINISPRQIDSINFWADIKKILENNELDPKWIDLEITENEAMNRNMIIQGIISELSSLGISISIDDFGTGYSSLSYIKRYNIDRLKIARELIENISSDRNDLMIVKAIIMMAKGLNLITIAEGVETEEQLKLLKELGCDELQGFLLSKPLSGDLFEARYLRDGGNIVQNQH